MKKSTVEWIEKAEGDWEVAQIAYRARKKPNYDAAGFHVQQCIEKYLKAKLNEAGLVPEKTHDLVKLLKRVIPLEPHWQRFQMQIGFLTDFAVMYRYPGFIATKAVAKQAIQDCREIRRVIRTAFGLPV